MVEQTASEVGVESIEELDEKAAFHFTAFSDGWGIHPNQNEDMAKRERWMLENGSKFATTAGDHLTAPRDGWTNQFNKYIADPSSPDWWRENFYPALGDHDCQFYSGYNEDDGEQNWGAAWPMLDGIGLYERDNVQFAHEMYDWYAEWLDGIEPEWDWWDGLEADYPDSLSGRSPDYYVTEEHEGVTVHIIISHSVDYGDDMQATGFPRQSKRFMMETLDDIDKGDDDIILMTSQSWSGNFVDEMSREDQKKILGKADITFSGNQHKVNYYTQTSHEYQKWNDDYYDYSDHEKFPNIALPLNTGAQDTGILPGYWSFHVFEDPLRVTAQYISTQKSSRELQRGPVGVGNTWPMRKVIDGPYEAITSWSSWDESA